LTQFDPLDRSDRKNLKIKKSKMAAAVIFENRKITISGPQFERFQRNFALMMFGPLVRSDR